ncbi:MAG: GTP-binding protein EngB [Candidatus Thorarchaeota archaeon]
MKEFAWFLVFVGRPNAGKSSLISKLTIANPIIGKKPGSTRRINEYTLANKFKVIDVPGWGKVHSRTKEYEDRVKDEIIDFFEENKFHIPACVLVIDIKSLIDVSERLSKKGIIPVDQELYSFLSSQKIKPIVVFNKIDKISDNEMNEAISYFKELVNFDSLSPKLQEAFIPVSARSGFNLDKLRDIIRERLRESGAEEYERYIKIRN